MDESKMAYCASCRNELSLGDVFCSKCGARTNIEEKHKADNQLAWVIALLPLFSLIVQNAISVATNSPLNNAWPITLILNTIMCHWDFRKIRKVAPEMEAKGTPFLVPVYLYKRAKALRQSLATFIVWIITFAVLVFVPQSVVLDYLNFGFGSYPTIQTVKDSYMDANDTRFTLGQAIDDYLENEKWTSFVTDTGQTLVQVTGNTRYYEGAQYSILLQFIVNKNSYPQFSYYTGTMNGKVMTYDEASYFFQRMYGY